MKIFPSILSPDVQSEGEIEIFNLLSQSVGKENWTVFHSLGMKQDFLDGETEADFVFLMPGIGILCLEVKACKTLGFDGTTWTLGQKTENRGPYKQANNAKWRLRNQLVEAGIDMRGIPVVSGVWFTEISKGSIPPSIERFSHETLYSEDLKKQISGVISTLATKGRNQLPVEFKADQPTIGELDQIHNILQPRFEALQAPKRLQEQITNFSKVALEQQVAIFDAVTEQRAVVIDALAGTGKTFLAAQAARVASANGQKCLLLCHNKLLAEELKNILKDFGNVTVSTISRLMTIVAGVMPDDLESKQSGWWDNVLPELALTATRNFAPEDLYDVLIIDEAQDVGQESWLVFIDSLLNGGLQHCQKVVVLGDFSNQDLFADGEKTKAQFLSALGNAVVFDRAFQINCRNALRVGHWVGSELGLSPNWQGFRRQDDLGRPLKIVVTNEDDLRVKLLHQLNEALKRYQPEDIVVLSAQPDLLGPLMARSKLMTTTVKHPRTGRIRYGSPFEFKGLEASCILMVEFFSPNPRLRETFYVSATRSLGDFVALLPNTKSDQLKRLLGEQ